MNFGKAVKLCRSQRGYSQEELARRADISVSYLSLLERNERDPALSTVEQIAKGLGVPLSILAFLGTDSEELTGLTDELRGKLASTALQLIHEL